MRRWQRIVLVTALGFVVCTFAGCTAARNGLGTGISSCFRVLPTARLATGTTSRFEGARLLPGGDLVRAVDGGPHEGTAPAPPARLSAASHEAMCLVAFGGTFRLATATRGWAPAPGPYRNAIVVVRQSTGKVVATVLFGRLPRGIHFFELSGLVRPKPSPDTDVGVVRPAGY